MLIIKIYIFAINVNAVFLWTSLPLGLFLTKHRAHKKVYLWHFFLFFYFSTRTQYQHLIWTIPERKWRHLQAVICYLTITPYENCGMTVAEKCTWSLVVSLTINHGLLPCVFVVVHYSTRAPLSFAVFLFRGCRLYSAVDMCVRTQTR